MIPPLAKATSPRRAVHFSPREPIPPAALLGLSSLGSSIYKRESLYLLKQKLNFS
jgi:hypothetical protein